MQPSGGKGVCVVSARRRSRAQAAPARHTRVSRSAGVYRSASLACVALGLLLGLSEPQGLHPAGK